MCCTNPQKVEELAKQDILSSWEWKSEKQRQQQDEEAAKKKPPVVSPSLSEPTKEPAGDPSPITPNDTLSNTAKSEPQADPIAALTE